MAETRVVAGGLAPGRALAFAHSECQVFQKEQGYVEGKQKHSWNGRQWGSSLKPEPKVVPSEIFSETARSQAFKILSSTISAFFLQPS